MGRMHFAVASYCAVKGSLLEWPIRVTTWEVVVGFVAML